MTLDPSSPHLNTYHGSCHCGAVRFECDVDLARGTSICNCSICAKSRYRKIIVEPAAFRLRERQEILSEYSFPGNFVHHLFCRRCGIKPFARGHKAELGGEFYGVNVACLDDVPVEALLAAPLRYQDGRSNNWGEAPAVTAHL